MALTAERGRASLRSAPLDPFLACEFDEIERAKTHAIYTISETQRKGPSLTIKVNARPFSD